VRNGGAREEIISKSARGSGAGQRRAGLELSGEVRNGCAWLEQSGAEQRRVGPERGGAVKNGGAWGQSGVVRCGMVVRGTRAERCGMVARG